MPPIENIPSVSPTAEIKIFGETHTLKFGFRAFKEIGVNPFDPASVKAFEEAPKSTYDLAKQIWAGLLHEYYGRNASRKGEAPPTIDDVMDELDPFTYLEMFAALQGIKGASENDGSAATPEKQPANPPAA